jgi:hypothetical protein
MRTFLRRLARDTDAASTIFFGLALTTLMGTSALAVDFGSMVLAKRRLQGITDAAVLSALGSDAAGRNAAIKASIAASGARNVGVALVQPGRYTRDAAVDLDRRFTSDPSATGALRLTLRQDVPLFFGTLLTGRPTTQVATTATAARADAAAFSLGSQALAVSNGIPAALLSALAGTNLMLTADDTVRLSGSSVQVARFADALRVQVGKPQATFGEVFGSQQNLSDVVSAAATASVDSQTARLLASVANQVQGQVRVGDIIDLGKFGQDDFVDGRFTASVDSYTLLRSLLQGADSRSQQVSLGLTLPGLASVNARIAGGPGTVHSPLLSVTDAQTVTLRTGQTRIALDARAGVAGIPGLATLDVPLFVEIAPATARLSAVTCNGQAGSDRVSLSVVPSVGTAALASYDRTRMTDMTSPMPLGTATLANITLLKINGYSNVALGGTHAQTVTFSRAEIDRRAVRQVVTDDIVTGIAASVLRQTRLTVSTGLLTVNASLVTNAVGTTLGALGPGLDSVLNDLTAALGVRLGVANVAVDQVRCGMPVLI